MPLASQQPKNFPRMTCPRVTGLASSGKIVRFSRSAGICRAAIAMVMSRAEIQMSNMQRSLT